VEDSVKLTDTQQRLLAAASKRDDRALERPPNLTGGAAGKVVSKLVTEGLIEEIQSRGSLPVWRRDGDNAHTLRITKRGLQAIRDDEAAHGDAQNVVSAVREVNAEENSQTACGLINAAYVRGKVLTTVRAKGETFQIVPILVIGVLNETGVQSVPQNVYFSVFKIDERVA
jgi:hypothetical protein